MGRMLCSYFCCICPVMYVHWSTYSSSATSLIQMILIYLKSFDYPIHHTWQLASTVKSSYTRPTQFLVSTHHIAFRFSSRLPRTFDFLLNFSLSPPKTYILPRNGTAQKHLKTATLTILTIMR